MDAQKPGTKMVTDFLSSTCHTNEYIYKLFTSQACLKSIMKVTNLSPNIQIQILLTDLHTFPSRINSENLIKDQSIFPLVIILPILITFSLDHVWILLGENWCWSLLRLKRLRAINSRRHLPFKPQDPYTNSPDWSSYFSSTTCSRETLIKEKAFSLWWSLC